MLVNNKDGTLVTSIIKEKKMIVKKGKAMTKKQLAIYALIILIGFFGGRLAFRAIINLLVGGTLFGGNGL